MSYKTGDNLIAALESFSHDGSYAAANRSIGASANGTIWRWIAEAKAAKETNDRSFWYLTWRESEGWWIDFIGRARSEQVLMLDGLVRAQTAHGVENLCYNPVDGRPLVALAPEYAHLNQEQFDKLCDPIDGQPLDPRDRYQWADDARTVPIFQTKVEQVPASLRQKTMSAVVPGWKDTQVVEQTNKIALTVIAPAPWIPKAQRQPPLDVGALEALPAPKSVEELREERKSILLRQAAEHLADPNRVTRPTMPTGPYTGSGRPTPNDPPEKIGERDATGKAPEPERPYVAPAPVGMPQAPLGPLPSYVRRRPSQPVPGVRQDGSRQPMQSIKR